MSGSDTTWWTMIAGAAAGDEADRRRFAARYVGVIRAYLVARWRGTPLLQEVDDATQEVFVESFREGGALSRLDRERTGVFRAFLYGVVRNVARRYESGRGQPREQQPPTEGFADQPAAPDDRLSQVFDRAWAREVMREAAERMRERARAGDADAQQRVELLRLRFHEGMPIRGIARLWETDAERLHHEYARARREFRAALAEVVAEREPGSPDAVERECETLLTLLA